MSYRNTDLQKDAAMDAAYEWRDKKQNRDEKGLCHQCGENPQNPYLGASLCLDCWNKTEHMGCMAKGCPKSPVGSFRQGHYCEVHLANLIHGAYQSYLEHKTKLEQRKEEFEQKVEEVGVDPRNISKPPRDMTDVENELQDELIVIKHEERDLGWMKSDIQDSMEDLDQPFPENFEVFG